MRTSLSLRTRVLAGLGAVAVVLVAVAWGITSITRNHLIQQVDEQLVAEAGIDRDRADRGDDNHLPPVPPLDTTVTTVADDATGDSTAGDTGAVDVATSTGGSPDDGRDDDHDDDGRDDGRPSRSGRNFEGFLFPDGYLDVQFRSDLPGQEFSLPVFDPTEVEEADGAPFSVGSRDGDVDYRAIATDFGDLWAVRALPLNEVDETVRRMVLAESVGVGVVLIVLAAVAWWVIHLGIRPIKQMTETATAIADGDLGARVTEPSASGTETAGLARALNTMMGRIETAVDRQARSEQRLRTFVADASHELRTPVTTIKGYAELYRHGGLPPGEPLDDAMRRTEQEANRMGRLVEDMLALARLDRERPIEHHPVDLTRLVTDAAEDGRATAPDRPITTTIEPDLVIDGDEDRLRQVAGNLIRNALVHTPDGTPIEIRARSTADGAAIEVADRGPGMEPEIAARVTERFFRADTSRSRERGGSGLGLAIVDAVVRAHGGSVLIDSTPGDGTTVVVHLPRHDREPATP